MGISARTKSQEDINIYLLFPFTHVKVEFCIESTVHKCLACPSTFESNNELDFFSFPLALNSFGFGNQDLLLVIFVEDLKTEWQHFQPLLKDTEGVSIT